MDDGLGRLGQDVEAVVFDLDGTLFRGGEAIPGAAEAVRALQRRVRCRFLSNNGESMGRSLARRLGRLGFDVDEADVVSSADLVFERLISLKPGGRVLPLISEELAGRLSSEGFDLHQGASVDFVVVGVDRALTRQRLVHALHALMRGATLIATNEDPTYPNVDGLRPAAGAYVGFFRGMGFEPRWFCGKPDEQAVRSALDRWDVRSYAKTLFVGDNLRTDIAAADRIGARSALVLTGVSELGDVRMSEVKPTAVFVDVETLVDRLLRTGGASEEGSGVALASGGGARHDI
jgi:4-nitrophenyl phosphatase